MELKGNIRVFCRVRPVLFNERTLAGEDRVRGIYVTAGPFDTILTTFHVQVFSFPDNSGERRQIELHANPRAHISYGQNGGRDAVKKYNFDFDMVFDGSSSQEDVFLEVSALVQSALDGYSVCIFAYGQTGYVICFAVEWWGNLVGVLLTDYPRCLIPDRGRHTQCRVTMTNPPAVPQSHRRMSGLLVAPSLTFSPRWKICSLAAGTSRPVWR